MRMGSPRRWTLLAVSVPTVLALIGLFAALPSGDKSSTEPRRGAAPPSGLTVRGSQLVDGGGRSVRLRGFNTSGTEYACIEGWGIFDLPGAPPTRVPDAV